MKTAFWVFIFLALLQSQSSPDQNFHSLTFELLPKLYISYTQQLKIK